MIVDSSIWEEEDYVCKIFITLLAIKDPDHVCRFNAYQIGKKANKSEQDVLKALEILSSPDRRRIEPQPNEGRRIERVADGWLILNGQKYQDLMQDVVRQRQQAQWQREQRMIERAIRTGEGLNPSNLTPAMKARFERAKAKGKRDVEKKVDHEGQIAGRKEQINVSLNGSNAAEDSMP
jgi:hypothetical protein